MVSPPLVSTASRPSGDSRSAATGGGGPDIDAAGAVAVVDERGRLRVADARQDARRDLDDGGLDAELGGRGGDFEPDQPAADDQQRPALMQMGFERPRLGFGAQVVDAFLLGRKRRQLAIDRAGGEHERVIADAFAGVGHDFARAAIDLGRAGAGLERDAAAGDALGAGDRRVMGRHLAGQHRLRERRLLVGLAVLVVEQQHVGRGVLLLGGERRRDPRGSAADDHDLAACAHFRIRLSERGTAFPPFFDTSVMPRLAAPRWDVGRPILMGNCPTDYLSCCAPPRVIV